MYGEKQIINPQGSDQSPAQTNSLPSTVPPIVESDYSGNVKKGIRTDFLDILLPFAGFSAVYVIITALFYSWETTVTGAYLAFLAFTTVCITVKQKKFPLKAIFPLILCVLVSVTFSLRYSDIFSPAVFLLFYLSGLYCMALTETNGAGFESYLSLYKQIKAFLFVPVTKLFLPLISPWQSRKAGGRKLHIGVPVGIICGIPVFIVVANLLSDGDAAFSNVISGFTEKIKDIIEPLISEADPFCIIIALIFTPWIVSTVFAFRHGIVTEKINRNETEEAVKVFSFVPMSVLGGFYGVVAVCYVLYLAAQFSYLFGAFSGDIPLSVNISLSEYARRGFFEMSTVALINLILIGAGAIVSKRDESGRLPKLYKAFSVFYCLFTVVLIITAMSKMGLYITELGLTEKRILVFVADIILLVTFLCVLVRIFRSSFPYMKISMYTALILVTLYLIISPDVLIANFNTKAYLSGQHKNIDLETICYLSDEYQSAKALDRLTESKNEVVAALAKNELYEYYRIYVENESPDAKPQNLSGYLFRKYLTENGERFKGYKQYEYYDISYEYDINKLMEDTKNNGKLFETKEVTCTFRVKSERNIYGIYISNPYSNVSVGNGDVDVNTFSFNWIYSDNLEEAFAEIEVEDGSEYKKFEIYLSDKDSEKDSRYKLYITGSNFCFELCDGENGELRLVEATE